MSKKIAKSDEYIARKNTFVSAAEICIVRNKPPEGGLSMMLLERDDVEVERFSSGRVELVNVPDEHEVAVHERDLAAEFLGEIGEFGEVAVLAGSPTAADDSDETHGVQQVFRLPLDLEHDALESRDVEVLRIGVFLGEAGDREPRGEQDGKKRIHDSSRGMVPTREHGWNDKNKLIYTNTL